MDTADIIYSYFPQLTAVQREQFEALGALYAEWNAKINVVSRRDIDSLYEHHVLHSLGIAYSLRFPAGARVLDVGTGGGFPGIPLAIMFPETQFHLIDSIGKKVRVAQAVADAVGLKNVTTAHRNVIEEKTKYHYIVSRAVMRLDELVRLVRKNVLHEPIGALPPGLLCLKGGDIREEMRPFRNISEADELSTFFKLPFFEEKKVVYVRL